MVVARLSSFCAIENEANIQLVFSMTAVSPDIEDLAERREFGECTCTKCATLCRGTPGIYDPRHLHRLLTEKPELASACVIDKWLTQDLIIVLSLRPRTASEKGGQIGSPFGILNGDGCVHLGPGGCKLTRNEMPIECVVSYACDKSESIDKDSIARLWITEMGSNLIAQFQAKLPKSDTDFTRTHEVPCLVDFLDGQLQCSLALRKGGNV